MSAIDATLTATERAAPFALGGGVEPPPEPPTRVAHLLDGDVVHELDLAARAFVTVDRASGAPIARGPIRDLVHDARAL